MHYIDQITAIHKNVEKSRGAHIPDAAYLELLYMLIDYSIRAFELLEQKLTLAEKKEVYNVFYRVGERMELKGLATTYEEYLVSREKQLDSGLFYSRFTPDLYKKYKKHLGIIRYLVLKQAQVLVAPVQITQKLHLGKVRWLLPVLYVYKFFRLFKMENLLKTAILPTAYVSQVRDLDAPNY